MKNIHLYVLLFCIFSVALPARADEEYGWDARQNSSPEKSFWNVLIEEAEKVDAITPDIRNNNKLDWEEDYQSHDSEDYEPLATSRSNYYDETRNRAAKRRVVKSNPQYEPYEPFQTTPPPPMSQAVRNQLQKR